MLLKLNDKWGIVPSPFQICVGHHPVLRYNQRIADVVNPRERITGQVLNGTVVLERTGITYFRGEDNMILPCVKHQEAHVTKLVVKTVLSKDLNIRFGGTSHVSMYHQ